MVLAGCRTSGKAWLWLPVNDDDLLGRRLRLIHRAFPAISGQIQIQPQLQRPGGVILRGGTAPPPTLGR